MGTNQKNDQGMHKSKSTDRNDSQVLLMEIPLKQDVTIDKALDFYLAEYYVDLQLNNEDKFCKKLKDLAEETSSENGHSLLLPLIVSKQKKDGYTKSKKMNDCYYKPIPPFTDCNPSYNNFDKDAYLSENQNVASKKGMDSGYTIQNGNNSESIQKRGDALESNITSVLGEINKQISNLSALYNAGHEAEEIKKELNRTNTILRNAITDKNNAEQETKKIKRELDVTNNALSEANITISKKNIEISGLKENSKIYSQRIGIFSEIQNYAKIMDNILREIKEIEAGALDMANLTLSVDNKKAEDDLNYYVMRIIGKYANFKKGITNYEEFCYDIHNLADSGILLKTSWLFKEISNVNEKDLLGSFKLTAYQKFFKILSGAAIIMSDEFAYLLPQWVSGVGNKQVYVFTTYTKNLLALNEQLGYSIIYVKPGDQLRTDGSIENKKFAEANIPSGTIFEILKLAVNYGTSSDKTEVSAKE